MGRSSACRGRCSTSITWRSSTSRTAQRGTFYERKAALADGARDGAAARATRRSMRLFSSRLLDRVRTFNDGARCFVVPFAPRPGLYPLQPPVDEPVVGLLGSMHWPPSRSAAERLLTRIWPLREGARAPRAARRRRLERAPLPRALRRHARRDDRGEPAQRPTDSFSRAAGARVPAPGRGSADEDQGDGGDGLTACRSSRRRRASRAWTSSPGEHALVAEDDRTIARTTCARCSTTAPRSSGCAARRARCSRRATASAGAWRRMMDVCDRSGEGT